MWLGLKLIQFIFQATNRETQTVYMPRALSCQAVESPTCTTATNRLGKLIVYWTHVLKMLNLNLKYVEAYNLVTCLFTI